MEETFTPPTMSLMGIYFGNLMDRSMVDPVDLRMLDLTMVANGGEEGIHMPPTTAVGKSNDHTFGDAKYCYWVSKPLQSSSTFMSSSDVVSPDATTSSMGDSEDETSARHDSAIWGGPKYKGAKV